MASCLAPPQKRLTPGRFAPGAAGCLETFRPQTIEEPPLAEVKAEVTGTIWKITCAVGEAVAEGGTVAIIESMKMEIPVEASADGTVTEIRCQEGQPVNEGDVLVVMA
jgi:acetyl-CoA carboxylase biotin carboxyl carrier protein